ncbi:hypothetical protein EDC96DRAFT_569156 [Choanephora cucurbitarum]|nr:hypothetical protein EDC96DRAFT_569156 [Choanephora cucurbitarum]
MFVRSASELGVEAEKGEAKTVWDGLVTKKAISFNSKTFTFKERLVFCGDHGPYSIQFNEWCVDGVNIGALLVASRMEAVQLVSQKKPMKESLYLLLSCVLDVPSNRSAFVLDVEEKILRRIRRAAGCLPSVDFNPDLLFNFFEFHTVRKREKAMEEEDDDDDKEGNEEGKEAKGKGKEEDAGEDQEDTEEILSKMTRRCKKDKNEEGLALVAVTRMITENDNWVDSITEESFIDQHLLPFVKVIFLNDRTFVYCRSAGRIPLSDSSRSLSKGKDSCLALKPDFCVMYDFQGENVGLLAIEVKLPNARSSQVLSDRSRLALELKRMIDQQVLLGSRKPESFGVLVEGFECTFFSCSLHQSGCYVFGELQRLSLPKSDDDLMLIPDLVLAFMKMKRAMKDSIAQLRKKQKTEQLTSLEAMIKQTVELPYKLASSSCT